MMMIARNASSSTVVGRRFVGVRNSTAKRLFRTNAAAAATAAAATASSSSTPVTDPSQLVLVDDVGITTAKKTNLIQFNNHNHNNLRATNSLFPSSRCAGVYYAVQRAFGSGKGADEYPPHTLFPMPALSPTMEAGSIASWTVRPGDSFEAGSVLCTIETDKASVDFEAQDDGVLAKILKHPGDGDIKIGTPICVVVEERDDVAAFDDFQVPEEASGTAPAAPSSTEATTSSSSEATTTAPATTTSTTSRSGGSSILMPSARHLSESKGYDATGLLGSGKGGRVTKADVLQALANGTMPPLSASAKSGQETASTPTTTTSSTSSAAAATTEMKSEPIPRAAGTTVPIGTLPVVEVDTSGTYEDIANNKMRKIIASRLTESKRDVPHMYTSIQVELDQVLKLRKALARDHDVKVSVNDFVLRCCALSLRDVPEVNATYDAKTDAIAFQPNIDVSVAVATPTGLITPIVFNADQLGLYDITNKVRDLAARARDGKLAPEEYQGGTFSVSNLGMFGIQEFSAVINPPQAAILAVGGGSRQVVSTPYVDGRERVPPSVRTVMTARLSADRRVVDEATASLFLSAFRRYINEPELLIL